MCDGDVVRLWLGLEVLLFLLTESLGLGCESSVENVREPPEYFVSLAIEDQS